MARKRRYVAGKDKRPAGSFVALAHIALRSAQWAALSPFAVKLLLDLLAQYNGSNNGDLTTAWSIMSKRCWKSKQSLFSAIKELESCRWIQRTRQGGRHVATLWGVTIFALDVDNLNVLGKLDIRPTDFRRGAWTIGAHFGPPIVPIDGNSCAPSGVPIVGQLACRSYQSTLPQSAIAPPVVPVNVDSDPSLARPSYSSKELPSTVVDPVLPSRHPDPAVLEQTLASVKSNVIFQNEFVRARERAERKRVRLARQAARRAIQQ